MTAFRGVSEGDVTRYAFAKREPLRVEHEAFRDAVLGRPSDVVTMQQGLRTLARRRGRARIGHSEPRDGGVMDSMPMGASAACAPLPRRRR